MARYCGSTMRLQSQPPSTMVPSRLNFEPMTPSSPAISPPSQSVIAGKGGLFETTTTVRRQLPGQEFTIPTEDVASPFVGTEKGHDFDLSRTS